MDITKYKGLNGYKIALRIAVKTYKLSNELPDYEKFGLYSQITRASVSIGSNFSEGFAYGTNQKSHFIKISLGSINELEFQLSVLKEIYKLEDKELNELLIEEKKILLGILRSIK